MTRKEAMRQNQQTDTLRALGFTSEEAEQLRRISMTLHRWYELECGDGNGCIERDENTGVPFWHNAKARYVDPHDPRAFSRIPDRETGAIRRLDNILRTRNGRVQAIGVDGEPSPELYYYLQTDPRGAVLYLLRPGDVPEGKDAEGKDASSYYTRGICIY